MAMGRLLDLQRINIRDCQRWRYKQNYDNYTCQATQATPLTRSTPPPPPSLIQTILYTPTLHPSTT